MPQNPYGEGFSSPSQTKFCQILMLDRNLEWAVQGIQVKLLAPIHLPDLHSQKGPVLCPTPTHENLCDFR